MASPELVGRSRIRAIGGERLASLVAECLTDADAPRAEVSGVGLSGQMHGLVLLMRRGKYCGRR